MEDKDEELTSDNKTKKRIIIKPKKPKRSGRDIVEIVKEKFDILMARY